MKIAVCIATYHRPEGLRKLLVSLMAQRGVDEMYEIVVVDNDPEGSARTVVDQARRSGSNVPVTYEIEREPGISAARNLGIGIARSHAALAVAFIDDDEFATPYWLATMYQRLRSSNAAAISGPVEPVFPSDAPEWAYSSRLYHRETFLDGARLKQASTANSMLRLEAIAGMREPFNPAFGLTGGSDTLLYQTIVANGGTIIWEPAALVYEDVPETRLTMNWIVARGYRHGITLSRCDRTVSPSRRTLVLRAAKGISQFPAGLIQIGLSLVRRDEHWRRGIVRLARGAGVLAGLSGLTYDEYQRINATEAVSSG